MQNVFYIQILSSMYFKYQNDYEIAGKLKCSEFVKNRATCRFNITKWLIFMSLRLTIKKAVH